MPPRLDGPNTGQGEKSGGSKDQRIPERQGSSSSSIDNSIGNGENPRKDTPDLAQHQAGQHRLHHQGIVGPSDGDDDALVIFTSANLRSSSLSTSSSHTLGAQASPHPSASIQCHALGSALPPTTVSAAATAMPASATAAVSTATPVAPPAAEAAGQMAEGQQQQGSNSQDGSTSTIRPSGSSTPRLPRKRAASLHLIPEDDTVFENKENADDPDKIGGDRSKQLDAGDRESNSSQDNGHDNQNRPPGFPNIGFGVRMMGPLEMTDLPQRDTICLCTPPPKVPRPRNAFILFRQHFQSQVVAQNPGLANPDISKIIGRMWQLQPEDVKSGWKQLAEEEKARHRLQHPDYRYQPRRSGKYGGPAGNRPGSADGAPGGETEGSVQGEDGSSSAIGGDSGRCSTCGGRFIATPRTPRTPSILRPALPTATTPGLTPPPSGRLLAGLGHIASLSEAEAYHQQQQQQHRASLSYPPPLPPMLPPPLRNTAHHGSNSHSKSPEEADHYSADGRHTLPRCRRPNVDASGRGGRQESETDVAVAGHNDGEPASMKRRRVENTQAPPLPTPTPSVSIQTTHPSHHPFGSIQTPESATSSSSSATTPPWAASVPPVPHAFPLSTPSFYQPPFSPILGHAGFLDDRGRLHVQQQQQQQQHLQLHYRSPPNRQGVMPPPPLQHVSAASAYAAAAAALIGDRQDAAVAALAARRRIGTAPPRLLPPPPPPPTSLSSTQQHPLKSTPTSDTTCYGSAGSGTPPTPMAGLSMPPQAAVSPQMEVPHLQEKHGFVDASLKLPPLQTHNVAGARQTSIFAASEDPTDRSEAHADDGRCRGSDTTLANSTAPISAVVRKAKDDSSGESVGGGRASQPPVGHRSSADSTVSESESMQDLRQQHKALQKQVQDLQRQARLDREASQSPPVMETVSSRRRWDRSADETKDDDRVRIRDGDQYRSQDCTSQASGIRAMVMSVAYHNKLVFLRRISPPPPRLPPRGPIIAIEGSHTALVAAVGRIVQRAIVQSGECALGVWSTAAGGGLVATSWTTDKPPRDDGMQSSTYVGKPDPDSLDAFHQLIISWRTKSREIIQHVTSMSMAMSKESSSSFRFGGTRSGLARPKPKKEKARRKAARMLMQQHIPASGAAGADGAAMADEPDTVGLTQLPERKVRIERIERIGKTAATPPAAPPPPSLSQSESQSGSRSPSLSPSSAKAFSIPPSAISTEVAGSIDFSTATASSPLLARRLLHPASSPVPSLRLQRTHLSAADGAALAYRHRQAQAFPAAGPRIIPVALITGGFSLALSDHFASTVPIKDRFSPIDHWEWMATLWRGIPGPDLVVYADGGSQEEDGESSAGGNGGRDSERNTSAATAPPRAQSVDAENANMEGGGGLIVVNAPPSAGKTKKRRSWIDDDSNGNEDSHSERSSNNSNDEINDDEADDGIASLIDEKTERRLAFEVMEWVRTGSYREAHYKRHGIRA